jgi:hypothetical protein
MNPNPLIADSHADTVTNCRAVLSFLAAVQPIEGVELNPSSSWWHGLALVLVGIQEALEHTQTPTGAQFDA